MFPGATSGPFEEKIEGYQGAYLSLSVASNQPLLLIESAVLLEPQDTEHRVYCDCHYIHDEVARFEDIA